MQESRMIRGRLLYISGDCLYLARGAKILRSEDGGKSWHLWVILRVGFGCRLAMRVPLLARLLRFGVHHLAFSGKKAVVIANKESFLIESDRPVSLGPLRGSRPVALCAAEEAIYYGEYRSNPERSLVHIYGLDFASRIWKPFWRFKGVRHVHGVFFDPYTETYWVTTGDENHESAIWKSPDGFIRLEKIVGGLQRYRAIQLLFTYEHVYFGSDAPDEKNYIYRMDREGKKVEKLAEVGGSVFHGCKVGNHLFFSTAVEPSKVNPSKYAQIWGSVQGESWQRIYQSKKDIWPLKYFQYGQVFFPAGPGDGENLWFSPMATHHDQKTFSIPIDCLFN